MPRAFLRVAGATLARHQLALALAAGCERIACLARALEPELAELQHEAERAGARFHLIQNTLALSGLVTAADELLVVSEGLLPASGDALDLLNGPPAVLTLPVELALPLGFERIDINFAGAGLMLLPGRLVERLAMLPGDADAASALMRIACQAGIASRPVPEALIASRRWLLVRDEGEAQLAETGWVDRHARARGRKPGTAIAGLLVRRFGAALLHAGSGSRALALAALGTLPMACIAGWFGFPALGLGMCAAGFVLHRGSAILEKIRCDTLTGQEQLISREWLYDSLSDIALVLLLVMASPDPAMPLWTRAFTPMMLIGLLRLLSQDRRSRLAEWFGDGMVVSLALTGLVAAQWQRPGMAVISLCLLVFGIIQSALHQRITRA